MTLSERMKLYESQTTKTTLIPMLPIVARLDGKNFSTFTRSLEKPYDKRLSQLMIDTTKYLVNETNANCGYHQSDEITLVWYNSNINSQPYFNGKIFKIITDLSAMCSVYFNNKLSEYLPEKANTMPRFDARVWNVPNLDEAVNSFLWRENDAVKNSISMAAQEVYSPKQLLNKNGSEKQEMLFKKGINWNDYPSYFKRGTYIQRKIRIGKLSIDELNKLPEKHNARKDPNFTFERKSVEVLDLPPLSKIENRIDVLINGQEVILKK